MWFYTGIYITLSTIIIGISCDCGILAPPANPSDNIEDGTNAQIFPWHVIIYVDYPTILERRCSGILISSNLVITAARCTGIHNGSQLFVTTSGYIDHTWTPDSEVQKSRVKTVYRPNGHVPVDENDFREGVVWLILQYPFNMTSSLGPACIDVEDRSDRDLFQPGLVGRVTYYPGTANVTEEAQIRKAEIIPRSDQHCSSIVREKKKENISYNPSCARYARENGSNYNFAGSGFYSQRNGRWYLRGIVCGVYTISEGNILDNLLLLVNINRYADDVNKNGIMKSCGIESSSVIPLIANGRSVEVGEFPWHVGIYRKKSSGSHEQICGGSLISSNIVISAAHCFYDEITSQKQRASRYAVAAGKRYRHYNWPERFVQKSAVTTIYLPSKYYGAAGLYAEDIAWIILQNPLNVSTLIRPICLGLNNWYETVGEIGKIAGWGKTADGSPSLELQKMSAPYISHGECILTVPSDYRAFLTIDKFCAGYLNGSSPCVGDSGGGLAFKYNGRWYLRGVVSNSPRQDFKCGARSYTAFTDVGRFNDEFFTLTSISISDLI